MFFPFLIWNTKICLKRVFLEEKNFTREWKFHLISRQVKWVNTTFQKVEIKEKQISSRRRKIPTGGGGSSFRGESFFLFVFISKHASSFSNQDVQWEEYQWWKISIRNNWHSSLLHLLNCTSIPRQHFQIKYLWEQRLNNQLS